MSNATKRMVKIQASEMRNIWGFTTGEKSAALFALISWMPAFVSLLK